MAGRRGAPAPAPALNAPHARSPRARCALERAGRACAQLGDDRGSCRSSSWHRSARRSRCCCLACCGGCHASAQCSCRRRCRRSHVYGTRDGARSRGCAWPRRCCGASALVRPGGRHCRQWRRQRTSEPPPSPQSRGEGEEREGWEEGTCACRARGQPPPRVTCTIRQVSRASVSGGRCRRCCSRHCRCRRCCSRCYRCSCCHGRVACCRAGCRCSGCSGAP